jgi:quinol monooxygenase YgiN
MTIAKIVTLRADADHIRALDDALTKAREAAAAEPGTRAWEYFPGVESWTRVVIELFDDDLASTTHDTSASVAILLEGFAETLADDPQVQILRQHDHVGPQKETS